MDLTGYKPLYTKEEADRRAASGVPDYTSVYANRPIPQEPTLFQRIDKSITDLFPDNKPPEDKLDDAGLAEEAAKERERQAEIIHRRKGLVAADRGEIGRKVDAIRSGLLGAVGSSSEYVGRHLGIKTLEEFGDSAQIDAAAYMAPDATFADKLFSGAGSLISTFAVGGPVGLLARGLGAARGISALAASGAGGLAEAFSQAQQAYEDAKRHTGNNEYAEEQGFKTAIWNIPINILTNRIGIFGKTGVKEAERATAKALARGASQQDAKLAGAIAYKLANKPIRDVTVAGAGESFQEGFQQIIGNIYGHNPVGENVAESALIGGILGSGVKTIGKVLEPRLPAGIESKGSQDVSRETSDLDEAIAGQLQQHAADRLSTLQDIANGTPDQDGGTGPDGEPIVIPGNQPQPLTPQQAGELKFLQENANLPADEFAAAIAKAYPGLVEQLQARAKKAAGQAAAATPAGAAPAQTGTGIQQPAAPAPTGDTTTPAAGGTSADATATDEEWAEFGLFYRAALRTGTSPDPVNISLAKHASQRLRRFNSLYDEGKREGKGSGLTLEESDEWGKLLELTDLPPAEQGAALARMYPEVAAKGAQEKGIQATPSGTQATPAEKSAQEQTPAAGTQTPSGIQATPAPDTDQKLTQHFAQRWEVMRRGGAEQHKGEWADLVRINALPHAERLAEIAKVYPKIGEAVAAEPAQPGLGIGTSPKAEEKKPVKYAVPAQLSAEDAHRVAQEVRDKGFDVVVRPHPSAPGKFMVVPTDQGKTAPGPTTKLLPAPGSLKPGTMAGGKPQTYEESQKAQEAITEAVAAGLTHDVKKAQEKRAEGTTAPAAEKKAAGPIGMAPDIAHNLAAERRDAGEQIIVLPHPTEPGKFYLMNPQQETGEAVPYVPPPPPGPPQAGDIMMQPKEEGGASTPFTTKSGATLQLSRKKLKDTHEVVEVTGGFVIRPITIKATGSSMVKPGGHVRVAKFVAIPVGTGPGWLTMGHRLVTGVKKHARKFNVNVFELRAPEVAVISRALEDLVQAGFNPAIFDRLNGIGSHDTDNYAQYNLEDKIISVRTDILAAAGNPASPEYVALRSYLAHELGHLADHNQAGGAVAGAVASAQETTFYAGYDPTGKFLDVGGVLSQEIVEHWASGGELAEFFIYPLTRKQMPAWIMSGELFAQSTSLYFINPGKMRTHLPKTFSAMEEIYGQDTSTAGSAGRAGSHERVRATLRALSPTVGAVGSNVQVTHTTAPVSPEERPADTRLGVGPGERHDRGEGELTGSALTARKAQISWEAAPSKHSGKFPELAKAPLDLQAQYATDISAVFSGEDGRDVVGSLLNVEVPTIISPSAWDSLVGWGMQSPVPVSTRKIAVAGGVEETVSEESRQLINIWSAVRGLVLRQDAVYWHFPVFEANVADHNGQLITFQRPLSVEQTQELYRAIMRVAGHSEWAPGVLGNQARVLNFTDVSNAEFHRVLDVALKSLPASLNSEVEGFRADGAFDADGNLDLVTNDWRVDKNGERYQERISSAQSPDVLWRATIAHADAVDRVDTRYANEHGWTKAPPLIFAHGEVTPEEQDQPKPTVRVGAVAGGPPKTTRKYQRDSISTRNPTAVNRTEDPLTEKLLIDMNAMKRDPDGFAHTIGLVEMYPNYKPTARAVYVDQVANDYVRQAVSNLLWIYDQIPAAIRERSKLWYDGAHQLALFAANHYNTIPRAAAGVFASLSPQQDWYKNVSLGIRVMDIWTHHQNTRWSPEMERTARRIFAKNKFKKDLALIRGKTFAQVGAITGSKADPIELQAMWLRTYDEAHNTRQYQIITPEGNTAGFVMNEAKGKKPPQRSKVGWPSNVMIAKAISIMKDPSRSNISEQLGQEHKIRSFYNNIIDPNSPDEHVTSDTHAVAAANLRALSGEGLPVVHNFGGTKKAYEYSAPTGSTIDGVSGTYGILADIYRLAARARGVLPREMQSVTWEAIRGLFTDTFKSQAVNVRDIDNIWLEYRAGRISLNEARKQVLARAGGINNPTWLAGSTGAAPAGEGYSGHQKELLRLGLSGGTTGSVSGGTRSEPAAGGAPARLNRAIPVSAVGPARGLALTREGLEAIVARTREKWAGGPEIVILSKPSDLQQGLPADTAGAFWHGKIYLFSENLKTERQALTTIAHEAVGHHSIEEMLGPEGFARLQNAIRIGLANNNVGLRKLAQSVRETHGELAPGEQAAEIVARAAELAVDAEGNIRPGFAWFKRILSQVAEWLRAQGINVRFTDAELAGLLSRAARRLEAGADEGIGGALETALQNRVAPWYYSALARSVAGLKVGRGDAGEWQHILRGLSVKGVKKEELEATGVLDWLELEKGKGPITKDQVEQYLAKNGVQVNDVLLAETPANIPEMEGVETRHFEGYGYEGRDYWAAYDKNGNAIAMGDTNEEALENARNILYRNSDSGVSGVPQYNNPDYMLPGGKNYKELLLTLPTQEPSFEVDDYIDELNQKYGTTTDGVMTKSAWSNSDLTNAEFAKLSELGRQAQIERQGRFTTGHHEVDNTLAHVRFNERIDRDGKRVLFLEEIQSDWAEQGRDMGFNNDPHRPARVAWTAYTKDLEQRYVDAMTAWSKENKIYAFLAAKAEEKNSSVREQLIKNAPYEEMARFLGKDEQDKYDRLTGESKREETRLSEMKLPPPGPFVGKTEAWTALVIKRMIRYAAQNGFDRIAYTTGEQQNARYNLSQKIRSIEYSKVKPGERGAEVGNYFVQIRGLDGDPIFTEWNQSLKDIEKTVGKDVAARVEKGEGKVDKFTERNVLTGDDMVMGAAPMEKFYGDATGRAMDVKRGQPHMNPVKDKEGKVTGEVEAVPIVTKVANDILKKIGGGRVGQVDFDGLPYNARTRDTPQLVGGVAPAEDVRVVREFTSRVDGRKMVELEDGSVLQAELLDQDYSRRPTAQPGFDITPEMRDNVMAGQALMNRAPARGRLQTLTAAFKNWFGDSQVVDSNGDPLVVYTGTSKDKDFSKFNAPGNGIWFTSDPASASQYARENDSKDLKYDPEKRNYFEVNTADRVLPVYLSIKNPMRYDKWPDKIMAAQNYKKAQREEWAVLKAQGYDGVIWGDPNGPHGAIYVAFQPTQIKSATGNKGTFDPTNPDIRLNRIPDYVRNGSPELQSGMGKIDTYAPNVPVLTKMKGLAANWQVKLQQGLADQFVALKDLGPREYMLARMSRGADGALEGSLFFGLPMLDRFGAIFGDLDGKGFLGHLSDLKGEHDRFFAWIAANRAERLMGEGKERLWTAGEIREMKKLNEGHMPDGRLRATAYTDMQKVFEKYNKAIMDIAEKTGLVDGASRKSWEHGFYVPFYRMMENDRLSGPSKVKSLARQYAFHKLNGGTENMGDLLHNTLSNWSHLLSASLANQAALAALKKAEQHGVAVRYPSSHTAPKGATFAMENGTEAYYEVHDPFTLQAISAIDQAGFKGIPMMWMRGVKKALTFGVTVSPAFRLKNLMRDTIAAVAQTGLSYNMFENLNKGFAGTSKKSEIYQQMLFGGGLMRFGSYSEDDRAEHAKRAIRAGITGANVIDTPNKVIEVTKRMWDAYQDFGDRMENINRAALYQKKIAEGKSHFEAAYEARDMMDFSSQGAWTAVRFLTQVVPFMNARIQGLYKTGRSAKEDPARFLAVTGAVGFASIALLLAYYDDDDWKKREQWDRDTYWWFKAGDKAFRIPKPFEIGAFGTLAERTAELLINDEFTGKDFAKRLQFMLAQTFQFNPIPQLFKPMIDIYANKDSFTDRPIETPGMEHLSKPERIGPATSIIGQGLGSAGDITGLSPVQIDFLMRSYLSWLGSMSMFAADSIARPFVKGEKPTMRIGDYPVIGDFVKSLPQDQSRYTTMFYEQAKEVSEVMADIRHMRQIGNKERAAELREENIDKVRLSAAYTSVQSRLTALGQQQRKVNADTDLSGDEKRERLDEIAEKRNRLTQEATQRIRERQAAAQ